MWSKRYAPGSLLVYDDCCTLAPKTRYSSSLEPLCRTRSNCTVSLLARSDCILDMSNTLRRISAPPLEAFLIASDSRDVETITCLCFRMRSCPRSTERPWPQSRYTTHIPIFPTQRDFYTYAPVNATLPASLGHINVHVRDGSAILTHTAPTYTTTKRARAHAVPVALDAAGAVFRTAYVDDGESLLPSASRDVTFRVAAGSLRVQSEGTFRAAQTLESATILGEAKPSVVKVGGEKVKSWEYTEPVQRLVGSGLKVDLNGATTVAWS